MVAGGLAPTHEPRARLPSLFASRELARKVSNGPGPSRPQALERPEERVLPKASKTTLPNPSSGPKSGYPQARGGMVHIVRVRIQHETRIVHFPIVALSCSLVSICHTYNAPCVASAPAFLKFQVCVCVCVCVGVGACACALACASVRLCVYACVSMCACGCLGMHVCASLRVCMSVCACLWKCECVFARSRVRACFRACLRVCV